MNWALAGNIWTLVLGTPTVLYWIRGIGWIFVSPLGGDEIEPHLLANSSAQLQWKERSRQQEAQNGHDDEFLRRFLLHGLWRQHDHHRKTHCGADPLAICPTALPEQLVVRNRRGPNFAPVRRKHQICVCPRPAPIIRPMTMPYLQSRCGGFPQGRSTRAPAALRPVRSTERAINTHSDRVRRLT